MKDKKPQNEGQSPNPFKMNNKNGILLVVFLAILIATTIPGIWGSRVKAESYNHFKANLASRTVSEVAIQDNRHITYVVGGDKFKTTIPYTDSKLMEDLLASNAVIEGKDKGITLWDIVFAFLPFFLMVGFMLFMMRRLHGSGPGGIGEFKKSRAKQYKKTGIKTTFDDVAGQKEAKFELQEVVEFLKNPAKFHEIGARIPKGVLLVGMPGTGKTLLAKAVAGEAGVSFLHMSGSDFVEMFVGVGAGRVRDLFEEGRASSPCIIFIDELDAVGRERGSGLGGGNDEREQTLNQILVEMDGFEATTGVIVLAATNRPDILDPALLRPGRFDRQVVVDMPDADEREAILKVHAKKIKMGPDVDLNRIARATPQRSGADLANLVNEAALIAARRDAKEVSMHDFEEATDKVFMGLARKSKVMTREELLKTAHHEAGHALMHYYLPNADPLHKLTIVPRGQALGVAYSLPEKDRYSYGSGWLIDRIKIAMGGYVAEELFYGETTTGVSSDMQQATKIARSMVREYGMSKLGFVSFNSGQQPIFIGREIAQHSDYSEETARRIDAEVERILSEALADTRAILAEHKDQLELLAETVVDRETLTDAEVRELLGFPKLPSPFDEPSEGDSAGSESAIVVDAELVGDAEAKLVAEKDVVAELIAQAEAEEAAKKNK